MSSHKANMFKTRAKNHEAGFTVIELLIATTVFAMVLVLITSGIIEVTKIFFKGDNESSTQQVTTTIVNTISQAIQFNGGAVTATTGASAATGDTLCIGNEQFSYWPGYELVSSSTVNSSQHQTKSALVENSTNGCTGIPSTSGRELLGDSMRLSSLSVQCISSAALCASTSTGGQLYQVEVRVVYGDDGLLNNPTATNATCNGGSGQQFCAVSDVSTIVSERL